MGHGYGAYNSRVRKELKAAEDSIRSSSYERVIAIDAKGKRALEATGTGGEINLRDDDAGKLKNTIVTHNHPLGSTFSPNDVRIALNRAVSEIRVCHEKGFYSLTRNFKFGGIPPHYKNFPADYKAAVTSFEQGAQRRHPNRNRIPSERDAYRKEVNSYARSWLKDNAEKYGWIYREGGR